MDSPEERARVNIDRLLTAAGWEVQDRSRTNLGAAVGVAVREFPLATGEADYLLFVDRKAIGAVEAKPEGATLSGVEAQSGKYSVGLPAQVPAWHRPLPFLYESTGVETFFTNGLDPQPRSRRVFAFHRPETLAEWADGWWAAYPRPTGRAGIGRWRPRPSTLRGRLQQMPPLITTGLWDAQIEAITNLEPSLAEDRPRALIQMATGSGKTFTAVSSIYRLIKFGGARRVLFLVDRSNLGRQALKEFQQYVTPDDGRKFTELYNVQRLHLERARSGVPGLHHHDPAALLDAQRRAGLAPDAGGAFAGSTWRTRSEPAAQGRAYNPRLPLEFFDVIFIDECHRSIYTLWRQVLEYFDAFLIGLTATPLEADLRLLQPEPGDGVPAHARPSPTASTSTARSTASARRSPSGAARSRPASSWTSATGAPAPCAGSSWTRTSPTAGAQPRPRRGRREPDPHRDPHVPRPALHRPLPRPDARCPRRWSSPRTTATPRTSCASSARSSARGNDFCQKITYRTTGVRRRRPDPALPQLLRPAHRRHRGHDRHRHRHQADRDR